MENIVQNISQNCGGFATVVIAWIATQFVAKVIVRTTKNWLAYRKDELHPNLREYWKQYWRKNLHVVLEDGGMPSSHSAVVSSIFMRGVIILASMGRVDANMYGADLAFGGITAIALIVVNDTHKRLLTGKQGEILNILIKERNIALYTDEKPESLDGVLNPVKINKGHTLPEVIVGITLGFVIAIVLFFGGGTI